MLTTINFNYQHHIKTNEINYIIAQGLLSAELESAHLPIP